MLYFSFLAALLSHFPLTDIGQKFLTHLVSQYLLISSYGQKGERDERAIPPWCHNHSLQLHDRRAGWDRANAPELAMKEPGSKALLTKLNVGTKALLALTL